MLLLVTSFCPPEYQESKHCFMMVPRNQFLESDLSDRTSLIHLLDNNGSEDNNEAHIIKHSPYYSESNCSNYINSESELSIVNINIHCEPFIYQCSLNGTWFSKDPT